jgi:hypothetical protein
MNDLPRKTLCKIIAQYGISVSRDPQRCEGLLRDLCGDYKREVAVLIGALRERVAADLLASQDRVPPEILLSRLSRRLRQNLALTEDAARWGVETWAQALGVMSEEDSSVSGFRHSPTVSTPTVIPETSQREQTTLTSRTLDTRGTTASPGLPSSYSTPSVYSTPKRGPGTIPSSQRVMIGLLALMLIAVVFLLLLLTHYKGLAEARVLELQEATNARENAERASGEESIKRKAAELRAQEAEENSIVWQVAALENRTRFNIQYSVSTGDGSFEAGMLRPGEQRKYINKITDIQVKFSRCTCGEYNEKQITLKADKTIGHEPNNLEKSGARVNYFAVTTENEISIFPAG